MVDDDDSDAEEYQFHQQSSQGAFQVGHGNVNIHHEAHGLRQDLPYGDRVQIDGRTTEDLYDNLDVDVETAADDGVLSPTDGYFRAAPETGTGTGTTSLSLGQGGASQFHTTPAPPFYNSPPLQLSNSNSPEQIQQAPHVPNVWVQDPSLQPGSTAESKAREADQERQANQQRRGLLNSDDAEATHSIQLHTTATTPSSSSQRASSSAVGGYTPFSTQDAYPSHSYHHQPSSSSTYYSPSSGGPSYTSYARSQAQHPPYYSNINSRYFPTPLPSEAPPAYTPSPTSPSSTSSPPDTSAPGTASGSSSPNYRTFTNNIYRTMGGREETGSLLARDPESMGGPPSDDFHHNHQTTTPIWRDRIRRRLPYLNWRSGRVLLGGLVLLLLTIGFWTSLISGFDGDGVS